MIIDPYDKTKLMVFKSYLESAIDIEPKKEDNFDAEVPYNIISRIMKKQGVKPNDKCKRFQNRNDN